MNRIRSLREGAGMTQRELAAILKCSNGAMSKYENSRYPLDDKMLLQLSRIFDVSVDYILGTSDIRDRGSSRMPPELTWDALSLINAADMLTEKQRRTVFRFVRDTDSIAFLRRYWYLSDKSKRRVQEYMSLLELADKDEGVPAGKVDIDGEE